MVANSRKQKSLRRIEKAIGRILEGRPLHILSAVTIRDLDTLADWLEAPQAPPEAPEPPGRPSARADRETAPVGPSGASDGAVLALTVTVGADSETIELESLTPNQRLNLIRALLFMGRSMAPRTSKVLI